MIDKSAKDRPTVKTATWKGIPIALEYVKGQMRHDVQLPLHYGYFPDSLADSDEDHVDVFLSADPQKSDVAFIVNQVKPTGTFDEHKVILGFPTATEAKEAYLSCYKDSFTGFGSIVAVTPYQLQWWLENGDLTTALDPEDFLPNGKAIKRASAFTPDYTPSDLGRFGLMAPHRKTAWINWYDRFVQGARTDEDEARFLEWTRAVRKNASLVAHSGDFAAMEKLVTYAVNPFPLVSRPHRKAAQDHLAVCWKKFAEQDAPIIAVDLDGTLAETLEQHDDHKIGPIKPEMVLLVNGLKALGCIICIWTVRNNRSLIRTHLQEAHVQFDYINDSPFRPDQGSNKIYADVYLDDRGVRAEGPVAAILKRIIDILRTEGKLK